MLNPYVTRSLTVIVNSKASLNKSIIKKKVKVINVNVSLRLIFDYLSQVLSRHTQPVYHDKGTCSSTQVIEHTRLPLPYCCKVSLSEGPWKETTSSILLFRCRSGRCIRKRDCNLSAHWPNPDRNFPALASGPASTCPRAPFSMLDRV